MIRIETQYKIVYIFANQIIGGGFDSTIVIISDYNNNFDYNKKQEAFRMDSFIMSKCY